MRDAVVALTSIHAAEARDMADTTTSVISTQGIVMSVAVIVSMVALVVLEAAGDGLTPGDITSRCKEALTIFNTHLCSRREDNLNP
jgi:hypothetical protein